MGEKYLRDEGISIVLLCVCVCVCKSDTLPVTVFTTCALPVINKAAIISCMPLSGCEGQITTVVVLIVKC